MWHDYFKPEHVEKFPDLHDVCWKAAKQASLVKRTIDIAEAQKLLDLIDQIDMMWRETGGPAHDPHAAAAARTGLAAVGGQAAMRRLGPLLGAAFLLTTLVLLYGVRRFTRVLVSGHSMEPTLRDGDWLLVDVLNPVTAGDLAVAWDPRQTDRLIVKRVREAGTDTDLSARERPPSACWGTDWPGRARVRRRSREADLLAAPPHRASVNPS